MLRRAGSYAAGRVLAASNLSSSLGIGSRLMGASSLGVAGAVGTVGVAGIISAISLGTGRTFENLAENAADVMFGTSDDLARATYITRERILGNDSLVRSAGALGTNQVLPLYNKLLAQEIRRQEARGQIMRDKNFQVKSDADLLLEAMAEGCMRAWDEIGEDVKNILRSLRTWMDYSVAGMVLRSIRAIFRGSR